MHVHLETSMLIRKAASARLTMSTSYETNTPPLSTKPRMLESCALTFQDANQVPLSVEHRDRLALVHVILTSHSSPYCTDSESKLSTTI